MRALLTITTIIWLAGAAAAEDLVMVGPAVTGSVAAADVKAVKDAAERSTQSRASSRPFDVACAGDPNCLALAGTELKARRLVGITVAVAGRELAIGVVLFDVEGKEVVAKRELTIKPRKLAKELKPALDKFLADAPVERAKALFSEGNKAFNLGEFENALALYTRSYRIKPLPGFLFNIAQCHRKLGHFQEAVTTYQAFLATHPDASNRSVVEDLIKEAQDQLAASQKRALDKAAEEGRREAERLAAQTARAAEERKAREAEASAAAERRKAEEARIAGELEKTYDRHPARKWAIVMGGLGAGALITGGVLGLAARSAQQSFHDAGCGNPDVLVGEAAFASCLDDRDRGQRYAQLANIFLIGGGVGLAAATAVFLIDPGNRERPDKPRRMERVGVSITPSAAHVMVRW